MQQSFRELGQNQAAYAIAQAILEGFNKHYRIFRETSRAAKERFENQDWAAVQQASKERIQFYDKRVVEGVERLEKEFGAGSLVDTAWRQIKLHYIGLLTYHKQPELAETYFNSVSCKILHRTYFHNNFIFVRPAVSTDDIESDPPSYRYYYPGKAGLRDALIQLIRDYDLKPLFADLPRDMRYVLKACRQHFQRPLYLEANHQIQVLSSLLYRNKGAYIVGKFINGNNEHPFAVPILYDNTGKLYLDTILLKQDHLNILFSSSRAYFMADVEVPSVYVQFLSSMLPSKPKWELYTLLGWQKHGKNLFYRDFLHHLKHSSDDFVIAPGIKGLVMLVFTLPSFPYVFKVIKDVFPPSKEVDRQTVKERYQLVKYHDRVGRMADTLEYSDVAFPKDRFTPELLKEVRREIPSQLEEEGDTLFIKHLYIERRLHPLNMYLGKANDEEIRHALFEYGNAIKQLATANIFPGDLLYKNFGLTRYKRVVFYDYDEIEYLTNCNFRKMPQARTEEDELSAEPWYSVGTHDIFPEEFENFLLTDPRVKKHFYHYHKDLLDPEYWKAIQQHIMAGQVEDVFPYPASLRFCNMFR
ncbi:MAG TPA: bifunctional isocitrate dehydrogenase kinase/phosphatase [Burkholderiales bacterium]|nr:bifunctional isocitrate dehydrogenase kinase/phosphatase [Burkholderiales bacterium]